MTASQVVLHGTRLRTSLRRCHEQHWAFQAPKVSRHFGPSLCEHQFVGSAQELFGVLSSVHCIVLLQEVGVHRLLTRRGW